MKSTPVQREELPAIILKTLRIVWFLSYCLPLVVGLLYMLGLIWDNALLSRNLFPQGLLLGIVWLVINFLIFAIGGALCGGLMLVCVFVVLWIEDRVISKMSERTINLLGLRDRKNRANKATSLNDLWRKRKK